LANAQDSVQLKDGRTEAGRVESEDYREVTLKSSKDKTGKVLRFNRDDIVAVNYGGVPDYAVAMNLVNSGSFVQASQKLTALLASASLRKELKPNVMFQLASAHKGNRKWQDAITAMLELVKAFPKTPHLRAAAQTIVDCRIALGDPAAGIADLDTLVKTAKEGGVEEGYLAAFEIFPARLLEAQKKIPEAKIKYDSAAAARSAGPTLIAEAKLGSARCEYADGHPDKAKEHFQALVDQDVGNFVLAGAWNGLADLKRDEALKEKTAEKKADLLIDALLMYLRGVVEFGPAPGESTGEYERAIAGSSAMFRLQAESEKDDARKKLFLERANQRLAQLKKEFPDSPYSQQGK
jgi:outer membrane protein assembly factor BamD (BamD/ComL family)